MAFSTTGNREPLADINVTPLVDVMLVLLIIFIVTAPMLARPIVVDLPQRTPQQLVQAAPPNQSPYGWMPTARYSGTPAHCRCSNCRPA